MNKIEITIGIPTYNEECNIVRFFDSLINQIYQLSYRFEIILVDDSDDRTMALIQDIRTKYSDLVIDVIHNNERMGASHAWNVILQKARGDVIILFDADIVIEDKCIEILINSISGEVGLCASNTLPISEGESIYSNAAGFIAYWLRSIRLQGLSQYTTMGRALAIDGNLGRSLSIPNDIIALDLYLQCLVIKAGKKVKFNDDAKIYFTTPGGRDDFFSQIVRAIKGHDQIRDFSNSFKFNASVFLTCKEFVRTSLRYPKGALCLILCYCLLPLYYFKMTGKVTHLWEPAKSTK